MANSSKASKPMFIDDLSPNASMQSQNSGSYKPMFIDDLSQQDGENEVMGWPGVYQDLKDIVTKNIPNAIKSIPSEYEGIKQQYENEPERIPKNLLAGVGEGIIGTLNLPHTILKELGQKGVIPDALKKYNELPFTHIPDTGAEKAMGLGEEIQGDALLRLIPQLLAGTKKGVDVFRGESLGSLNRQLNKSNAFIDKINKQHREFLGEGEHHAGQIANILKQHIEGEPAIIPHPETGLPKETTVGGLRKEVGEKFNRLEEDLPEITIPGKVNTKAIDKELEKLVGQKSNVSAEEKANFRSLLEQTHPSSKPRKIQGRTFFRAYRTLKHLEHEQRSKAYSGVSPDIHDEWIARANTTKQTAADMENIIKEHFPKGTIEKLHKINYEWSKVIAPLSENSLYQDVLKHGQTSKDVMKYLSGTTKGNRTLNAIIKNDPKLQRLVVAQKFASNPKGLAKKNMILDKYAELNPFIEQAIEQQKRALHLEENVIPGLKEKIAKAQAKKAKGSMWKLATGIGIGTTGSAILAPMAKDIKKNIIETLTGERQK